MRKSEVVQVFETLIDLGATDYIGIDNYLELALRYSINILSGVEKCFMWDECTNPVEHLRKFQYEFPLKSQILNRMLPKNTKLAIETAIQILKTDEHLTTNNSHSQ